MFSIKTKINKYKGSFAEIANIQAFKIHCEGIRKQRELEIQLSNKSGPVSTSVSTVCTSSI